MLSVLGVCCNFSYGHSLDFISKQNPFQRFPPLKIQPSSKSLIFWEKKKNCLYLIRSYLTSYGKHWCSRQRIKIADLYLIWPVDSTFDSTTFPFPHPTSSGPYMSCFTGDLIGVHNSMPGHPMKQYSLWWISAIFDLRLSFESHISHIDKTSYYHLGSITRLRLLLSQQDAELLIHAFITTRLNYYNLFLASLPECTLLGFDFGENSAAGVFNN